MIDITKFETARAFYDMFGGQVGHGIIFSEPIPDDEVLILDQAGLGQGAGASGNYPQKGSISIIYYVAAPYSGYWMCPIKSAEYPAYTTPLTAWTGQKVVYPRQRMCGRVDRIHSAENITVVYSGHLVKAEEFRIQAMELPKAMAAPTENQWETFVQEERAKIKVFSHDRNLPDNYHIFTGA